MKNHHGLTQYVVGFLRIACYGRPGRFQGLLQSVQQYEVWFNRLCRHHGSWYACQVAKAVHLRAKGIAGGAKPEKGNLPLWHRESKRGFPCALWRLERFLCARKVWKVTFAMTVLALYKAVPTEPRGKVDSRVTPGVWTAPKGFDEALEALVSKYRLDRVRPKCLGVSIRDGWLGTKGPYGGQGSFNACRDAWALLGHKDLVDAIGELSYGLVGSSEGGDAGFEDWLAWVRKLSNCRIRGAADQRHPFVSRFAFISEEGGKTRGVTPVNYHVQMVLRPLHDAFMEMLRKIPMDCSFDEAQGVRFVLAQCRKAVRLGIRGHGSFDLPDYTDRLPVGLMKRVVERLYGGRVSAAWGSIMRLPVKFGGHVGTKPFAVGAPMGVYALWPVAALTHHVIVQAAAGATNSETVYRSYRIRGDDNFMLGHRVIRNYLKIWACLGMAPSKEKSVTAEAFAPGTAEFAKHFIVRGTVVSGPEARKLRAVRTMDPLLALELVPLFARWGRALDLKRRNIPTTTVCALIWGGGHKRSRPYRFARKIESVLRLPVELSRVSEWADLFKTGDLGARAAPFRIMVAGLKLHDQVCKDQIQRLRDVIASWDVPVGPRIVSALISAGARDFDERDTGPAQRPIRDRLGDVSSHPDLWDYHPVARVIERLLGAVLARQFNLFSSVPKVYSSSKILRELRELSGLNESLRNQTRFSTRISSISKYSDLLEYHLRHKVAGEETWQPPEEGRGSFGQ